ncbi:MAG: sugar phosphate nucleotidyltransferase [Candidatus Berkelbacteria bacterium]|nr:sugar phosphate nucleotidyltransferase [Candidatus Berkelbacteria bacterium]
MKNIQALVLAAGKGRRINAKESPKALYPLCQKPMIYYCLSSLKKAGFKKPVVVIGFRGQKIKDYLKNKANYVVQKKQLGTGHATLQAKEALKKYDSVLIIYSDTPSWKAETFKKLIEKHEKTNATLSLVSVILKNPSFFAYGRIKRDKKGSITGIVEEKAASTKEKKIKESNPGCYLIKTEWLFKNLPKIKKSKIGEYYLTDILEIAIKQKEKINIMPICDWQQTIGINTKEQLELAEKILNKLE